MRVSAAFWAGITSEASNAVFTVESVALAAHFDVSFNLLEANLTAAKFDLLTTTSDVATHLYLDYFRF